jgi:hypothetical protein
MLHFLRDDAAAGIALNLMIPVKRPIGRMIPAPAQTMFGP